MAYYSFRSDLQTIDRYKNDDAFLTVAKCNSTQSKPLKILTDMREKNLTLDWREKQTYFLGTMILKLGEIIHNFVLIPNSDSQTSNMVKGKVNQRGESYHA